MTPVYARRRNGETSRTTDAAGAGEAMTAMAEAGEVLAALLEADDQAVFLVDPALEVRLANRRAEQLRSTRRLFEARGVRLTGHTRRVDVQLRQAVEATLRAPCDAPPGPVRAWGKPDYTLQLRRLELVDDPLVLVRVFEGYAAPDATGEVALALAERGGYPIHRRLSADGKHGVSAPEVRPPLPPLDPLVAFEAYARRGAMAPAAAELATWTKTISRHVRGLEAATGRRLVEGPRHRVTLTPAGRQLARALSDAFDILEAATRPRPAGGRRGRKPKEAEADLPHAPTPAPAPVGAEPSGAG